MAKNLLIVESPAKATTINKYLGDDFLVLASYGHVRDLEPREGAVDTENDFAMAYQVIERNEKHVNKIAQAAAKAEALYLATDLDREGEAISWHVLELLRERGLLENKEVYRVVFSEITPRAIKQAVAEPRALSMDLVNAQQARRALDYLVGFNLSPVLWRKVQRGLSAGRVQSPALRMIVEREEEIEAFVRQEYWSIQAQMAHTAQPFVARLWELEGKKFAQFDITDTETAHAARERLLAAAGGELLVADVRKKQRRRRPAAPFITSTLQQEAARKLGFGTSRTMRVAQQLYEGIQLGSEGIVGLISYMRTDAVHLSVEALSELRAVIEEDFGSKALPDEPQVYKSRSKGAQEAHEAIRPTEPRYRPDQIKAHLNDDQIKLYTLIWQRAVACQMIHATLDTVSVDLACGPQSLFRATGTTVVDPGFLAVYEESSDQKKEDADDDGRKLPALTKGDRVPLEEILANQHFTEPPPRYSEASLVKSLEEHGIGRPSTYANIIQVLLNREYVSLESRRFMPSDVGRAVANFLTTHFTRYVDYDFTSDLEDELDAVSRGEQDWVPLLARFWEPFKALVDDKIVSVDKSEATGARVLGEDPKSGKPLSVRLGRYGPYAAIGTKDDEEKPLFASLRPGQSMHTISMAEALDLFRLPRELGATEEDEPVSVGIGRFGPFVKFGSAYVSLKEDDDPYTIELPRALELVREKKELEANRIIRDFGDGLQVLNGRWGPYVSDGNKNARIPKERDPKSLSLEECQAMIEAAPERRGRGAKKTATKKAASRKTAAKKAATKKTATKKVAVKKAAKKAVAKKTATRKTAVKKVATKKAVAKKAAPRKTAAAKTASAGDADSAS